MFGIFMIKILHQYQFALFCENDYSARIYFIKINNKSQDTIIKRAKELACIFAFLYSMERENIPFR